METKGLAPSQLADQLSAHRSDVTQWSKGNRVPGDDTLRRLEEAADLPPHFLRIQKRLNKLEVEGYSIDQITDPSLLEARGATTISATSADLTPDQRKTAALVARMDYLALIDWGVKKLKDQRTDRRGDRT